MPQQNCTVTYLGGILTWGMFDALIRYHHQVNAHYAREDVLISKFSYLYMKYGHQKHGKLSMNVIYVCIFPIDNMSICTHCPRQPDQAIRLYTYQ